MPPAWNQLRRVPWSSSAEFEWVFSLVFESDEDLKSQKRGIGRMKAWMERGSCPHAVESTVAVLDVILRDTDYQYSQEEVGNDGRTKSKSITEHELRLGYSMAIVRFVNSLVDPLQSGLYAKSITQLASRISLPIRFVDLRHQATHEDLPSLEILRKESKNVLDWLFERYWKKEVGRMCRRNLENEDGNEDGENADDEDDEDDGGEEMEMEMEMEDLNEGQKTKETKEAKEGKFPIPPRHLSALSVLLKGYRLNTKKVIEREREAKKWAREFEAAPAHLKYRPKKKTVGRYHQRVDNRRKRPPKEYSGPLISPESSSDSSPDEIIDDHLLSTMNIQPVFHANSYPSKPNNPTPRPLSTDQRPQYITAIKDWLLMASKLAMESDLFATKGPMIFSKKRKRMEDPGNIEGKKIAVGCLVNELLEGGYALLPNNEYHRAQPLPVNPTLSLPRKLLRVWDPLLRTLLPPPPLQNDSDQISPPSASLDPNLDPSIAMVFEETLISALVGGLGLSNCRSQLEEPSGEKKPSNPWLKSKFDLPSSSSSSRFATYACWLHHLLRPPQESDDPSPYSLSSYDQTLEKMGKEIMGKNKKRKIKRAQEGKDEKLNRKRRYQERKQERAKEREKMEMERGEPETENQNSMVEEDENAVVEEDQNGGVEVEDQKMEIDVEDNDNNVKTGTSKEDKKTEIEIDVEKNTIENDKVEKGIQKSNDSNLGMKLEKKRHRMINWVTRRCLESFDTRIIPLVERLASYESPNSDFKWKVVPMLEMLRSNAYDRKRPTNSNKFYDDNVKLLTDLGQMERELDSVEGRQTEKNNDVSSGILPPPEMETPMTMTDIRLKDIGAGNWMRCENWRPSAMGSAIDGKLADFRWEVLESLPLNFS